jgi:hypothetical protein
MEICIRKLLQQNVVLYIINSIITEKKISLALPKVGNCCNLNGEISREQQYNWLIFKE